jgi:hypothetical protein
MQQGYALHLMFTCTWPAGLCNVRCVTQFVGADVVFLSYLPLSSHAMVAPIGGHCTPRKSWWLLHSLSLAICCRYVVMHSDTVFQPGQTVSRSSCSTIGQAALLWHMGSYMTLFSSQQPDGAYL